MNNLLTFLLESGVCLMAFYGFYLVALRSDKFLNIRRFYLLASCVLCLLIPFLTIPSFPIAYTSPLSNIPELNNIPSVIISKNPTFWTTSRVFALIYLLGVTVMSARLLFSLAQILIQINKGRIKRLGNVFLVTTNKPLTVSTFFHYILYSPGDFPENDFQLILAHERRHIQGFHTLDLLLAEVIIILHWFNPFSYLIKRELREVHEYLCDQHVVQQTNVNTYEKLIIRTALRKANIPLVSQFNDVSTKKRLAMMNKQKSSRIHLLKLTLIIPLILALVWACNNELTIQEPQRTITGVVISENGDPLPGVNVLIKGTTKGTVTDMNGNFSLELTPEHENLVISFIGRKSRIIPIEFSDEFEIVLSEDFQPSVSSVEEPTQEPAVLKSIEVEQELLEEQGEYYVTGKVVDASGKPLPGINVVVVGHRIGTVTNPQGEFRLKIPESDGVISYNFVGYESKLMKIE
jgi:beta-lactamase regulating signal transducer with metallopeptidase domain